MTIVAVYLVIINILTFCVYGADKSAAKRHRQRIPNRVLLGMAAIGGSVGALAGMYVFRHKTQTWYYTFTVPVMLILHIIVLVFLYKGGLNA